MDNRQTLANGDIDPTALESEVTGRRKLLLVYIHGFMGDESSFRRFPAHVHSLSTVLVQDTHVVYSKIYPRYRSRRFISIARDEFSAWLRPHESSSTDVVLLGHSMGGLVSAEVALMPALNSDEGFRHRILGTINFDVPFLGMHPGVISSGLASIFVPSETPSDRYFETAGEGGATSMDERPFWEPTPEDKTFNARFNNDVVLPARKFWQSVQHFVHKHGSDLSGATSRMVSSHIEFMSAMSNAEELRSRYAKLRLLEEDSETVRKSITAPGAHTPRVRFVNYYTVSSGRVKAHKSESPQTAADTSVASSVPEAKMLDTSLALDQSNTESFDGENTAHMPVIQQVSQASAGKEEARSMKDMRPPKDRKFCNLPPKDSQGQRDPTWIRIYMQDVDEVGAHCGMFFVDERYERLVADVAERVEAWIHEDLSSRLAGTASHTSSHALQYPDEKRT